MRSPRMRPLPLPISTARLVLRDFAEADFDAVFAWASDTDVAQHMFYDPRDEAETRAYLARTIRTQTQHPRRVWELAVVDRATERVIGACDLTLETDSDGDLGYAFRRDAWGRGYATEAARALVAAGFTEMGLDRIFALCEVGHVASARVLEHAGLRWIRTVERHRHARGRWWHMELFAVTRQEWNAAMHARSNVSMVADLDDGDAVLRASIAGVSDALARRAPGENAWSILECLEHLVVAEEYLFEQIASATRVAVPIANPRREAAIVERVMDRSRRIAAPDVATPTGRYRTLPEALDAWTRCRARTRAFAASCDEDLRCRIGTHPLIGQVNAYELLLIIAVHPRRHAQQIDEVRSALAR